jgi:Mrp family chromosome partitioning ATPase
MLMGRTFEVLGGRVRKEPRVDAPAAIPFPQPEPDEPLPAPELVPVTKEDLPDDDNSVPFIEVGGPRAKPKSEPSAKAEATFAFADASGSSAIAGAPNPEVTFHLLADLSLPVFSPPGPELVAYHRPEHPAARQFRRLADGIAGQFLGARPPMLLFTAVSGNSAGATVANLAVTRASDGIGRVVVIEAERCEGSSAQRFGVPPVPGLRELLARMVPMAMALHRTSVDGVYILPAGNVRIGADEAARLPALVDHLRTRFDWVIIDAPHSGTQIVADWAKVSDGVYLVLTPEEWDSPQVDLAREGIERAGGRLRGCVVVREEPRRNVNGSAHRNGDGH